jgi:hypothetical protein
MTAAVSSSPGLPLRGRRVELVPPTRAFVEELFSLAARQEIPWQWRGPETPKSFDESLWEGVLVQYAIRDTV